MTAMVTVNGTNLDNLVAQGIDDISGIHTVPAKRTKNVEIPGRHGALNVPQKRYGEASLVMPMWVRGVNPDGTIPSDPAARLAFHARLRALVQLFTIGELVTIQHVLTDGTARQIVAEVDAVVNFAISGAGRYTLGKFSVGLTAADPFWSDLTTTTATGSNLTTGQSFTATGFAAASAPMDDLTITIGPCSNPTITQLSTGAFVTYNGIIAAGQHLVIDTQAWTVTGTVDAGGTWTPSTAPTSHIARIVHGGGGRLFTLTPQNGGPVVQLTHTGGGSATVAIAGAQRHLVP